MILSDRDIRAAIEAGRVRLTPFDAGAVQSSSVDVRLGAEFRVFANNRSPYIDVRQPSEDLTELVKASEEEPFILHPGEFVLASTLEQIGLPDDLVARLEGKSSLGRLGLLIHSSLPGDEQVLFCEVGGRRRPRPIREIVDESLTGWVVAFDRDTLEVDYRELTGWYRGPADRIYEVVLSTGRRVRVTAGHNLFSLDQHGHVTKVRTGDLEAGRLVAVAARAPATTGLEAEIDCLELVPESFYEPLVLQGPSVDEAFATAYGAEGGVRQREVGELLGLRTASEEGGVRSPGLDRLDAIADGGVMWDEVVEVRDTGQTEPVYDLEVRPGGEPVENFLAGAGGVFVSNTAGFVDAGFAGHLTLELSNVMNLPITLYPGMKIGQLAFFQLSSPAEHPYGSAELGSKYQGQRGPTASRYYENFASEQDGPPAPQPGDPDG